MTARNDITGDAIKTKGSNDAYRSGWDAIFGKKPTKLDDIIATLPAESQAYIEKRAAEIVQDMEVYHLRSYGDVTKEQLDAYAAGTVPPAPDAQS